MVSVLGGRPWSELDKGSSASSIEEFVGRDGCNFLMLRGVLMSVIRHFGCRREISFANERNGMRWPCAMNGNRTMCWLPM